MKKFLLLGLLLVLALSVGMVSAQDDATTLVIGWEQEPPLLSPRSDLAFASLMTPFYNRGLWDWDENRTIFPVMVEEVPTLENGLVTENEAGNTVVTIRLKEGILWSDGTPITSADLEFTHSLLMDPATITAQRGRYPEVVESLEVVDDRTVTITYNTVWPDFQTGATLGIGGSGSLQILPAHVFGPILEAEGTLDNATQWSGEGFVGYGPYVLSEFAVGEGVTFTANPNWDGQAPAFTTVVLRYITETAQMLNAFEAGEIDIAFNFQDSLVPDYSAIEGAEVFNTAGVFGDAVWFNVREGLTHPALLDPNVRTALIMGIDRASLAEQLVGPGTQLARSWFPEAFLPEDLPFIEYDPAAAATMLDEAGWVDSNDNGTRDRDGVELILRFYTTDRQVRIDYQTVIQEQWAEIGVGSQLFPVPATILFASFLERGIVQTGDFDVALFALSSSPLSPYADAFINWFGCESIPTAEDPNGQNGYGFCSPELDALQGEIATTLDPEVRLEEAYEQARLFYDAGVWHGLYLRPTWYAVDATRVDPAMVREVGTLSANYFNNIEFWTPPM